jgi:hypothetical protein
MFAESVDDVIGVDTHRDSHALALVDAELGALIAEERVDANREGYRRALKLASGCGRRRLWAVALVIAILTCSSQSRSAQLVSCRL